MSSIQLEPFTHNSKTCMAVKFPFNFEVKEYIRKFKGMYWTKTHRTFYFYDSEVMREAFQLYAEKGGLKIIPNYNHIIKRTSRNVTFELPQLTPEKIEAYAEFIEYMKGKRFSKSTIRTYGLYVLEFLRFSRDKPLDDLDANDIRMYIEWAIGTLNYAVSTHRQMTSGLKHFAYFYPACAIDVERIYMPRKDKKLPSILSIEEILAILQSTKNLKHRTAIAMLYGSGLRIGELLSLELKDFDFDRNLIHIRNAKGRKDRYASIAKSLHPLLKNYHNTYQPKRYFMESPRGGMYSPGTIRTFLKQSCIAAKITKPVTPHTLRHSYATHLLEQGTDIRYIQELLGHTRPETTMIYTHVTTQDIKEIRSPLDVSLNKLSLRDNNYKNELLS